MGDKSNVGSRNNISFEISLSNGKKISFFCPELAVAHLNDPLKKIPEWIGLEFKKCSVCPLDGSKDRYCFAAQAVEPIVKNFGRYVSCEKVGFSLEEKDVLLKQSPALDDALAVVYLIVCARSKCPLWKKISMITSPLIIDLTPDIVLERLVKKFKNDNEVRANVKKSIKDTKTVIYYFSRRVSSVSEEDANKNAFVRIDTLLLQAELLLDKLSENDLQKLMESV